MTTEYGNGGVVYWRAKLTGSFSYNGQRTNCESAYLTFTVYDNNCTIEYKNSYCFGSAAYGEVIANHRGESMTYELDISMWCDANGNIDAKEVLRRSKDNQTL